MNEPTQPTSQRPEHPWSESPILATVARFAVPLTVFVSVIIFFQGHNKPGGGFIAGVLAAAAGAISLLAFGTKERINMSWRLVVVIAVLALPGTHSPTAAMLTLLIGAGFRALVQGRCVRDFPWWKISIGGFAIAILTGIVPMLGGHAFMDHTVWHYSLIVQDHLPTATFFDIGVYLIVFGTLMTIFVELGQEGGR